MKQSNLIIVIIIILNLFPSCKEKQKDIIGDWYSCIHDKGYYEYYFKDNYVEVKMELNNSLHTYVRGYYLSNDTIYLYQDEINQNDGFIIINSLEKNDDKLNVSIYTSDGEILEKNIDLVKIEEKIVLKSAKNIQEQHKINVEFEKSFFYRKQKNKCSYTYQEKSKEEGVLKLDED